jgi:hypothetical protein
MKKLILSIALLLIAIFIASAQQPLKVISLPNTDEVCAFTDTLASKASRKFSLNRQGVTSGHLYAVTYRDTEPAKQYTSPIEMTYHFKIEYSGRNEALEIEGTPSYVFSRVSGRFLDIIPFWLTYVEPEANLEDLSRKRQYLKEEVVGERRLQYILQVEGSTSSIIFRQF